MSDHSNKFIEHDGAEENLANVAVNDVLFGCIVRRLNVAFTLRFEFVFKALKNNELSFRFSSSVFVLLYATYNKCRTFPSTTWSGATQFIAIASKNDVNGP